MTLLKQIGKGLAGLFILTVIVVTVVYQMTIGNKIAVLIVLGFIGFCWLFFLPVWWLLG